MKTNYVKTGLYSRYINLGFFVLMAALLLSSLVTGCKQNVIKKKIPYPDPQPYPNAADYKVEHWQQNIEGSDYTLYEKETLEGKVGENTKAQAKNYAGFMNLPIDQKKITDDNSTVVQIKYNRKEITLTLNLNGGSTTTHLIEGNKLKGKYGAKIKLENLKKEAFILDKWEPTLPDTFPAKPAESYKASWTDKYKIIIKGDERTNIPENTLIEIPLAENKTWSDIKEQAKAKVTLKSEWNNDNNNNNYEVYEWRFNNENGEILTGDKEINEHLTVYAVTNYTKFNIKKLNNELNLIELTDDKGKGYIGSEPKGKIIIPDRIYYIDGPQNSETGAFSECNKITSVRFPASLYRIFDYAFNKCTGLTSIDLSRCTKLTVIDSFTFQNCTALTKVDLSRCKELGGIGKHAFSECKSLATVDLSGCKKLTKIGNSAFSECTGLASVNLSGCINLDTIDKYAFRECTGLASVDLSDCVELRIIDQYAFYKCTGLTSVDLSGCKTLTKIENSAFNGCTNAEIRLPENINTIDYYAFGAHESFCKKVLIKKSGPNFERIKKLVIDSGYPKDRIGKY